MCESREKITPSGTCKKCGDYTVLSANFKLCQPPRCGENEKIEKDGSCVRCEELTVVS